MTFLDTGFLFALVSERDAHHGRVVEVFNTFKGLRLADHLLTTNHELCPSRLYFAALPKCRSNHCIIAA